MAKKHRTGLQSKVSHIFAGIPLPKKRRSRTRQPDKKSDSNELLQTPAEQLPVEEQPVALEIHVEQTPVVESMAEESSALKTPEEQKQFEEPPVEQLMAPQPQIEEPAVEQPITPETPTQEKPDTQPQVEEPIRGQPPLIEPPVEQASVPFSQTIEFPVIEEPVEALQEPSSVKPLKTSITEKSVVKIPRKVSVRPKGKRLASRTRISSRRQTTMVILVIALSILLVFLLVKPFAKSPQNITGSGVVGPVRSRLAAQTDIVIDWQTPDVYPTDIRDPMLLASQQQFYSKTWKPNLIGLVYNEKQKYAIIGTEIVQEGDEINGVKIIKINKDSVEFERDGQSWTQEVQSENN